MSMADQETPKIIVDTDWKSQAQAEKERLAAAEEARKDARGTADNPDAQPAPTFEELVRMLATQALLYLGAFPDPETGRRLVALELAQFNIDMLAMLEVKTKGNLDDAEKAFLSQMVRELRLQFVEISKAVSKAVEQGRMPPQGAAGGPAGSQGMMGNNPSPHGMGGFTIQPPQG
jgi:hypothetical protein